MSTIRRQQSAIGAMYAGLGLTVVAAIVPFIDRATGNVLTKHLQAGYPAYSQRRIDSAAMTWLIYLSVLGALGAIGWALTIRAVKTGRRWARSLATSIFALGAGIAVFNLIVRDTSGDTGLPPLLGWVGMLPALVGVVAVTLLWRTPRTSSPA